MKLHVTLVALVALLAAASAQVEIGAIDNSCQFASFSPSVVPLAPDTHRASSLDNTTPIKFLFNNQQCTDFVLCVSDSGLSGGDGCAIKGANSAAANMCSLKGSARGDGTYMLSLNDPNCQGLDLVNCLSVTADGTAMEITQTCQAKLESVTISCTACGAPSGAVAKALQYKPTCKKYGYCGKCDCPPPIPPTNPICSASCNGKSSCDVDDRTYVTKDDRTSCQVLDNTVCSADNNVACTPVANSTGNTDVECPRFRANVELVFEKQLPTGQWVRVNAPGSTSYETPTQSIKCPDPIIVTGGNRRRGGAEAQQGTGPVVTCDCVKSGSCTPRKSGTCGAQKVGACACTKMGSCVAKPGPIKSELELCPQYGGTEFAPCNEWDCGKHDMPYPPQKGYPYPPKESKPYPPQKDDMPYPPQNGYGKPKYA